MHFRTCWKKIIKDFTNMAKPVTLLTHHKATLEWTPVHHTDFIVLNEAIMQAPIIQYPDPKRRYIVYTDALKDAWGAQLSKEHDAAKIPMAFLSHTITETQGNGVSPNRKPIEYTMPLPSGTSTFKELTSYSVMTINH